MPSPARATPTNEVPRAIELEPTTAVRETARHDPDRPPDVGAAHSPGPRLAGVTAALATASVLLLAGAASLIPSLLNDAGCAPGGDPDAPASAAATETIPVSYLVLYQRAGTAYGVPWAVLAAIGAIESDHGRSRAPGVQSGVNAFGCCAGPMQFNVRDGPPSTWQSYRVDGDGDGLMDPYAPAGCDRLRRPLRARAARATGGDVAAAIHGYNHDDAYVADVLARARWFARGVDAETAPATAGAGNCDGGEPATGTPADLARAEQRTEPRAYTVLPEWAMAGGRENDLIDSRLLENALWLLRRYALRVTAAREAGHNTHGDGTALDLVPASPVDQMAWDASAGALSRDLGWTRACAASGVRRVCGSCPRSVRRL
jgi:hypothetical protein